MGVRAWAGLEWKGERRAREWGVVAPLKSRSCAGLKQSSRRRGVGGGSPCWEATAAARARAHAHAHVLRVWPWACRWRGYIFLWCSVSILLLLSLLVCFGWGGGRKKEEGRKERKRGGREGGIKDTGGGDMGHSKKIRAN